MIDNVNKVFFTPGDVVQIKHDLPFKPIMLVKGKETKMVRSDDTASSHFIGIKCFWFTTDLLYKEEIFSTKDLTHYKDEGEFVDVDDLPDFLGSSKEERLERYKKYRKQGITLVNRIK